MTSMDLSIVIVNWNSFEFTKQCIVSLYSTIRDLRFEIIVVDNASTKDRLELSKGLPQTVRVMQLETNLGFAGANNLGAASSTAALVLFLNPDTLVVGDAIERLVTTLRNNPYLGALGCLLLNSDLTLQTSCVQAFPTISNQILALEWLIRRPALLRFWGLKALSSPPSSVPIDVDVVSGACILVRRDVFDAVGGFGTQNFLYAEEVELCYKIRTLGRRVGHLNTAKIIHFGGRSTSQMTHAHSSVLMYQSVYKWLRNVRGSCYATAYRCLLLLSALLRLVILVPLLLTPGATRIKPACQRAFRKWWNVGAWTLLGSNLSSSHLTR